MKEMGVPAESIPQEMDKLITEYADSFFSLTKRHPDKPIIGFTYRSLQEKMVRNLLDRGSPHLPGSRTRRAIHGGGAAVLSDA